MYVDEVCAERLQTNLVRSNKPEEFFAEETGC